jgi:anthranilate phosphoribosyltransferase
VVAEIKNGTVKRFTVAGRFRCSSSPLETVAEGLHRECCRDTGSRRRARSGIVVINAAAALQQRVPRRRSGAELASQVLRSGAAKEKLESLVTFTK